MIWAIALVTMIAPTAERDRYYPAPTVAFDLSSVEWFSKPGSGSIKGSALLRTVGGDVKTCAGLEVTLIPHSAYAEQRMRTMYGSPLSGLLTARNAKRWRETDLQYEMKVKNTLCDAEGKFEFPNLPAGDYFVTAPVVWGVPSRYFTRTEGGMLMKFVRLPEGQAASIVLTS